MKTLKIFFTVVLVLVVTVISIGCKKCNDKRQTCRIITAIPATTPSGYHLSYNSDGKLNTVTSAIEVVTYYYTGNTTIATTMESGRFRSKKIITLNAAGLATNVRTESNPAGTDWVNSVFEYSGVELIKSTSTSSLGGSPSIITYTWANQNMISWTSGSSTEVLDYYSDRPRQDGDILYLIQLIQGYEIYRTKNLVKYIFESNYTYEFGPDGNISSLTSTSRNYTNTLNYQYQCK